MKLAFVDVESTGFEAGRHRVVEAAVQVFVATPEGLGNPVLKMGLRQRIDRSVTPWTPEAFKVNGFNENHPDWIWALTPGSQDACQEWSLFAAALDGATLCAQNVPFDRGFIEAELAYFDIKPTWGRRFFDLQSLTAMAAIKLGLENARLHDVYTALGGPEIQAHRAMADVERGKFVYEAVTRSYFGR